MDQTPPSSQRSLPLLGVAFSQSGEVPCPASAKRVRQAQPRSWHPASCKQSSCKRADKALGFTLRNAVPLVEPQFSSQLLI